MGPILLLSFVIAGGLPQIAQATDYTVNMVFDENTGDVLFTPRKLEIQSGDAVIFTQADPHNIHNVMFEPNGIPKGANIPLMSPEEMTAGDTWKVTFATSGTYSYHCHPHYDANMVGEIIVDRPSTPAERAETTDHAQAGHHHHGAHGAHAH